jgi:AcrR family transcriptional regulator
MKSQRAYRMVARAESAEETGHRLIAAMTELFCERPFEEVTLDAVAARAGVTLQTLLRRFGSKSGLLAAAAAHGLARVEAQRIAVPVGDVRAAMANLFDHYEEWGAIALRLLAAEERFAEIAAITHKGRALHATWVNHAFLPALARRRGRARERLRVQLVAVCDVSMWKVLRRDLDMPRASAEDAMLGIVDALIQEGG